MSGGPKVSRRAARSRATTRLLACGAAAEPLFVVAVLVQDGTRAGLDPAQQPLSLLSLGDLGWIQVTTFALTGPGAGRHGSPSTCRRSGTPPHRPLRPCCPASMLAASVLLSGTSPGPLGWSGTGRPWVSRTTGSSGWSVSK